MRSVPKSKLIADIALSRDVLDYLNNGGRIITRKARKSKNKPIKALSSAVYTLSNKITL